MSRMFILAASAVLVLSAQPSLAEMDMKDMDKHMKEHMGGQTMQEKGQMNEKSQKQEKSQRQDGAAITTEAQAAGVTAKVTYNNPGAAIPVFNVVLDTHSAELDQYRFEEIVVLRDQAGKEHKPQLTSSKGSGHHREATLEFKDAQLTGADYVELVIKGVAGVSERVLKFDLTEGVKKSI